MARRSSTLGVVAALAVTAGLAGCGSSTDGTDAGRSEGATVTTITTTDTIGATTMRGERYCEVLLVQPKDGTILADVYNSYPLNSCPAPLWEALDPAALAAEHGAALAILNGPRFWLMDSIEKVGEVSGLPKVTFGGIDMYRQASVEVGDGAAASTPYIPHAVDRRTVFSFDAGHEVYELVSADGTVYLMQTWSQQEDPTLVEADLAGLAPRLALPEGWTYRSRTLDEPLRVDTTTAAAQVLQDDLGNSYSQLTTAG
jgi:hypothetical protein